MTAPTPKLWAVEVERRERATVYVASAERPRFDREGREALLDLIDSPHWDDEEPDAYVYEADEVPVTHDGYLDLDADEWVDLRPDS